MPNYDEFRSSVKFDLGTDETIFSLGEIGSGEYCKPPYPISLFQFIVKDGLYFALLVDDGSSVKCYGFGKQNDWYQENIVVEIKDYAISEVNLSILNLRSRQFIHYKKINDLAHHWWVVRLLHVAALMEVIACSNVEIIENKAPAFINRKRKEKNKQPFYSFKTLHIKPTEKKTQIANREKGTHASPRVHLRRGHIRKLSPNKRVWVQACVVGSKEAGVVEKDYRVVCQ